MVIPATRARAILVARSACHVGHGPGVATSTNGWVDFTGEGRYQSRDAGVDTSRRERSRQAPFARVAPRLTGGPPRVHLRDVRERYAEPGNVDEVVDSLLRTVEGSRGRRPLPDLQRAALVVLDLQAVFVDPESPAFLPSWPAFAPRLELLVTAFRHAGRPVIRTRHSHPEDDEGGTIGHLFGRLIVDADPLAGFGTGHGANPGEITVVKSRHSAFAGTGLADRLEHLGVSAVVLAGVQAQLCVLATAVEAGSHDLLPVVAADAVAAPDLAGHAASLQALAGGLAWIATADEIAASISRHAAGRHG